MAKLAILTGKLQGQKMTLPEKDIAIGRDDSCEIRLTGTEISRRHSLIKVRAEQITVKDLGSRNGTYVNDIKIYEETVLNHGDQIRVGTMIFKVESAPPRAEAPVSKPKPETKPVDAQKAEPAKSPSKSKHPDYEHMVDVITPSEDSIVNWLVDDHGDGGGSGDTTIVRKTEDVSAVKVGSGQSLVAPVEVVTPPPPKKQFATVKEEAADIIRRHYESLNAS